MSSPFHNYWMGWLFLPWNRYLANIRFLLYCKFKLVHGKASGTNWQLRKGSVCKDSNCGLATCMESMDGLFPLWGNIPPKPQRPQHSQQRPQLQGKCSARNMRNLLNLEFRLYLGGSSQVQKWGRKSEGKWLRSPIYISIHKTSSSS